MSLTLHFLRHGQTTLSRDNAFCGSGLDPELTSEGAEMAAAFAAAYAAKPWAAVYASPLRRTVATAQPLCEAAGLKMELRDGLKEIGFGRWEGLSVEEVQRDFHDDHLLWSADPAWNPPTGGETARAVAQRGMLVIDEIRARFNDGDVLLVAHKATIRILICSLLGLDVGHYRFRLGCPVGSLSSVEFQAHGPLLHALADRTHLSERLRSLPGT